MAGRKNEKCLPDLLLRAFRCRKVYPRKVNEGVLPSSLQVDVHDSLAGEGDPLSSEGWARPKEIWLTVRLPIATQGREGTNTKRGSLETSVIVSRSPPSRRRSS
jgi:hypothetical protein